MKVTTQGLATAVGAIAAVVAVAISVAAAGTVDRSVAGKIPPPTRPASLNHNRHGEMHWIRWAPTRYQRQSRVGQFASTATIGLESMEDLGSLRADYGLEQVRAIPALRAAQVRVAGEKLRALLRLAPADDRIRYVSPPGPRREVASMPADPLVRSIDPSTGQPYEWQFAASRVDRALDHTAGDPSIVVGIIDSGVDPLPDLAGKIDGLWSVSANGAVTSDALTTGNDDTGHGTAVASLIAANVDDGFGMAGFGGATHVIAVHVGYQGVFDETSIAIALMKLDALGVRIVNLSLGGPAPLQPILIDAIHKAAADGLLLVAATGNSHTEVSWPAAALQPSGGGRSYGLAVGASDASGNLASFSNAGKHLSLVAPGASGDTCSGVLAALRPVSIFDGGYCFAQGTETGEARYAYVPGTSFAAPEVAGVAALIWAARPALTNYQVADIIKQSARRASGADWTPTMGCGVLDAGAALELATSRSAAEWASRGTTAVGTTCTVDGGQPAAWPSEKDQTIRFAPLRGRTLGDPPFTVTATSSSGLPVSFTASGTCTMRRATVRIVGFGLCAITTSQAGNASYNPARSVTRTFTITKVPRAHASRLRN